jgi:hypothetical protein
MRRLRVGRRCARFRTTALGRWAATASMPTCLAGTSLCAMGKGCIYHIARWGEGSKILVPGCSRYLVPKVGREV